MACHSEGVGRPGRGPDGFGEDPRRLPRRARRPRVRASPRRGPQALPCALRVAAQGPRRGRGAQSAQPADRYPAGVRAPRAARAGDPRRHPFGRYPGGGAPLAHHPSPGHPHHDARVPLPHAHVAGPRGADGRRDGDPRRGARGRGHEARRAPRAVAGAPRRTAAAPRAPYRALRDGASRRRGGALPVAAAQGRGGAAGLGQGIRPLRRRPRARSRRDGRLARRRGRQGRVALRVAAGRGAHHGPRAGAPVHDRLRQLAPPRRAPVQPPQRDRLRARHGRAPARGPRPRAAHGRLGPREGGAARARAGAPRLGVQGAARAGRGGPQGGPTARRRRDVEPGAGHRHGLRRPRRAGRVAALGRLRAPARRPRGATRWARSRRASSSRSTAATSCSPPSSPSGCAAGSSRRCASRPTRWTSSRSSSSR
ncbi:hypothetical protein GA0115252_11433 [Streptomyces sp. DfronAA-171]|nr:hypothetical protein GA0115252_11433 [Streptomyces sp. DfronAA-171]